MYAQIRTTLDRCRETLPQDTAGAAALVVMLMVGLHLPGIY